MFFGHRIISEAWLVKRNRRCLPSSIMTSRSGMHFLASLKRWFFGPSIRSVEEFFKLARTGEHCLSDRRYRNS